MSNQVPLSKQTTFDPNTFDPKIFATSAKIQKYPNIVPIPHPLIQ